MKVNNTDLVKYGLFVNRALQRGDTTALFAHIADYMNRYGLKADSADLAQIPKAEKPLRPRAKRDHLRLVE